LSCEPLAAHTLLQQQQNDGTCCGFQVHLLVLFLSIESSQAKQRGEIDADLAYASMDCLSYVLYAS
jgi:hypothetical protein